MKKSNNFLTRDPQFSKNVYQSVIFLTSLFFILLLPEIANAGTGGAAGWQTFSDTLESWLTGVPAQSILLGGAIFSIYHMAIKHNLVPAGFTALAGLAANTLPAIIKGTVSALI